MTRTGRRFSILFAAIAALAKTGSAARREFLRSARVLAAVALIALVGALALPGAAQAQTTTTFVSNLGQRDVVTNSYTTPTSTRAQQFETGSNSGGYTLTEIVVNIRNAQTGTPAFALHTSTAGDAPGTKVVDLSGDSSTAGELTFGAGDATAALILFPFVSFQTVTQETTLTATVQAGSGYAPGSPTTASTRIVAADPAVTASIEEAAYTFAEDATVATVAVILRTATGVPSPNTDILVVLSTEEIPGQAVSNVDYTHFSLFLTFQPSDFTSDGAAFTARQEVTLAIVDDLFEESDETVTLALEPSPGTPEVVALRQADGTACRSSIRCDVTVTITDNDPSTDATLSGLSLGTGVTLDPIFASGTETYTAMVANAVTEVTVTPTTTDTNATPEFLNASDATLADADDVANGHQVALAVGDTVFKVQVTAEDGTTTETYTVTVNRAAQAQTTTTFVSNTGESRGSANGSILAQSFTAGSNPDGYTLSDVALIYFSEPSGADFTVTRVKSGRTTPVRRAISWPIS